MIDLPTPPSLVGTRQEWIDYAEKLEQEVLDHIDALEAAWLPRHVLLIVGVAFVAGLFIGHVF